MIAEQVDDKPTLSSVSMLSKYLLSIAQPRLFRDVCIQGEVKLDTFTKFLEDSPHVAGYLETLAIEGVINDLVEARYDLDVGFIYNIVVKLPKLNALQIAFFAYITESEFVHRLEPRATSAKKGNHDQ